MVLAAGCSGDASDDSSSQPPWANTEGGPPPLWAGNPAAGNPGWVDATAGSTPSWAGPVQAGTPSWVNAAGGSTPSWVNTAGGSTPGWVNASGGAASGGGGSYDSIASSIAAPTGTVSSETALGVAEQFEGVASIAVAGVREDAPDDAQAGQALGGQQRVECSAGGSYTGTASGNTQNLRSRVVFDDCCFAESFCISGIADSVYAGSGGGDYQYCISYDVTFDCELFLAAAGVPMACNGKIVSSGCLDDGGWIYVIQLDNRTYAVSGSYSRGDGTLEIRGSNGTWTCVYTNGSGSCSGTRGNFTF